MKTATMKTDWICMFFNVFILFFLNKISVLQKNATECFLLFPPILYAAFPVRLNKMQINTYKLHNVIKLKRKLHSMVIGQRWKWREIQIPVQRANYVIISRFMSSLYWNASQSVNGRCEESRSKTCNICNSYQTTTRWCEIRIHSSTASELHTN